MSSANLENEFTNDQEVVAKPEDVPSDTDIEELRLLIREKLLNHLKVIGLISDEPQHVKTKEAIRACHAIQRTEYRMHEYKFVKRYGESLLHHFADGSEIIPSAIDPVIYPVEAGSEDSALFRLSTLLWSVPVSRGYGRRMRFLVRDRSNGKLMGIFALADPVFNLQARDNWIGWTQEDRRQRLVHVMDAHIVGAVPPYSQLLGGKVVASLMTSQEVCDVFTARYNDSQGIISKQRKQPRLTLITVTSALGRSSLYNRLKLSDMVDFRRLGMTEGWGHFQIPEKLFLDMRKLLELEKHPYASNYAFGQGPNWRLRTIRLVLTKIGLNPDLLRHGITREVYASPLAQGWREFLCGQSTDCIIHRPSVAEIGHMAVTRWVIPRAQRVPDCENWTRADTWKSIASDVLYPITLV